MLRVIRGEMWQLRDSRFIYLFLWPANQPLTHPCTKETVEGIWKFIYEKKRSGWQINRPTKGELCCQFLTLVWFMNLKETNRSFCFNSFSMSSFIPTNLEYHETLFIWFLHFLFFLIAAGLPSFSFSSFWNHRQVCKNTWMFIYSMYI